MKEIMYNRTARYQAVNRIGKQTGLIIEDMFGADMVRLTPTNTKGTLPPCIMQIPKENIQEVIDVLTKLI